MKMKKLLGFFLCVLMLVSCLSVSAFAGSGAGITIDADKSEANVNETVTFTVYLCGSDKVNGGIWNYEFKLDIPEGLTYVNGSGKIDEAFEATTGFAATYFDEITMKSSAFGAFGKGYTGSKVAVMTFSCTVDNNASGNLTVSALNVILTDSDGTSIKEAAGSMTVSVRLPHVCTPVAVDEISADCTNQGIGSHYACTCGKLYADAAGKTEVTLDDLVISAVGHSYGDWSVTKEPTETENGLKEKVCSVCGDKVTETVPSPGHEHSYTVTVTAPTCTEKGYTTHICACGDSKVDTYVDAIGHSYGDWTVIREATETEDGFKEKICSVCGDKVAQAIPSPNHKHSYTAEITAPTCTEKGYTTHICACGDSKADTYVDATGHNYGDWTVVKNPTDTENGLKEKVCSVCGNKVVEEIDILCISPETGDNSKLPVLFAIMAVSAGCIGGLIYNLRRKNRMTV